MSEKKNAEAKKDSVVQDKKESRETKVAGIDVKKSKKAYFGIIVLIIIVGIAAILGFDFAQQEDFSIEDWARENPTEPLSDEEYETLRDSIIENNPQIITPEEDQLSDEEFRAQRDLMLGIDSTQDNQEEDQVEAEETAEEVSE